jgi:hypothetical protein
MPKKKNRKSTVDQNKKSALAKKAARAKRLPPKDVGERKKRILKKYKPKGTTK